MTQDLIDYLSHIVPFFYKLQLSASVLKLLFLFVLFQRACHTTMILIRTGPYSTCFYARNVLAPAFDHQMDKNPSIADKTIIFINP